MEISDRINGIDRILKDSGPVPVNGAVHGADGIHDGCTKGFARGYGREFPVSRLIAIQLALPLGIIVGNISGKVLIDAPLDFGFSLTGVILWLAIVLFFPAIASVYTAWKASRLTVNEVLVYE